MIDIGNKSQWGQGKVPWWTLSNFQFSLQHGCCSQRRIIIELK